MVEQKTAEYWIALGYRFDKSSECYGCKAKVELWWTPAKRFKKRAVLDAETFEPHFANCQAARDLRIDQRLKAGVL